MAHSMTGFGAARRTAGTTEVLVEIRSVNSKSCDVKTRLPRDLVHLDPRVQSALRARIQRGRVDVTIDLADAPDATHQPRVNLPLARGYAAAFSELARALGQPDTPPRPELIWAAPGVLEPPVRELGERLEAALDEAVSAALEDLESMRLTEGQHLVTELTRLTGEFSALIATIAAAVPRSTAQRRARLEARLREITGELAIDPLRLTQEVALLVDRSDVTEELARLDSHLVQLRKLLAHDEPIGRRLEFLLQEIHRETNTVGSKAATADIAHAAVEAKSVLERLKEQVQNVE